MLVLGKDTFKIVFYLSVLLLAPIRIYGSIADYIYKYHHTPSYSNYSTIGLIQNPSARFHEAGSISFSFADIDPYYRGSIVAYPFDWLEAAYQYTDVNNAYYSLSKDFSGNQTYKDKGFDLKFRLLKETVYLPQVALGFRDLAGSGTFSAEYLVATKKLDYKDVLLDFSGGVGWGGLNNNDVSNPLTKLSDRFKNRTGDSDTQGGEINFDYFFSGNMGLFGGVELFLPNLKGSRLKIEYDGTNYKEEGFPFGRESSKFAFKPVRQSDSRINYGIVFPINRSIQLRASYVKGNTFSLGFSITGFWGNREPITKKRDPYKKIKNSEVIQKVTAQDDLLFYRAALVELRKQNLYLQNASKNEDEFEVAFSQTKFKDPSRVIGRVARTLDDISPNTIKTFKITDVNAGLYLNEITINRSEFSKYKDENLYSLAERSFSIQPIKNTEKQYKYNPSGGYPSHFFNVSPVVRSQIGGPDGFYFGELSIGLSSEYKIAPNISIVSQGQIGLGSNFQELKLESDSVLPRVRSDIVQYLKNSQDYNIRRMQLNIFNHPLPNIYTKFTAGILEDMFAGIGGEIIYKPFYKNYAIGIEAWSVQQRDYEMLFDLLDYKTITGHLNFYYYEPNTRILFSMKGGKYLAKDSGFTFDFSRVFRSGLRMGVFFSLTDISEAEFGEGSFDKGFYFHIPVDFFLDKHANGQAGFGLKPLTRDGAAILSPSFNLYGVTYEGQEVNLHHDWSQLYE